MVCCQLNRRLINLIKEKCKGINSDEKTTLIVVTNIFHENIEITDENNELNNLQIKITDISNFIINYLDIHNVSDNLKDNLVNIIDHDGNVNDNLNIKDEVIAYCMRYVMDLYKKEKEIMRC